MSGSFQTSYSDSKLSHMHNGGESRKWWNHRAPLSWSGGLTFKHTHNFPSTHSVPRQPHSKGWAGQSQDSKTPTVSSMWMAGTQALGPSSGAFVGTLASSRFRSGAVRILTGNTLYTSLSYSNSTVMVSWGHPKKALSLLKCIVLIYFCALNQITFTMNLCIS